MFTRYFLFLVVGVSTDSPCRNMYIHTYICLSVFTVCFIFIAGELGKTHVIFMDTRSRWAGGAD